MEFIFAAGFLTKTELKYHGMISDFGKLKSSISCSCIFRKSIMSHTKLCNSVRHFYYRLGRAATAMRAQMSKIFGHEADHAPKIYFPTLSLHFQSTRYSIHGIK